MKKGIFFTLGLTFFAFLILSLSFLFSENSARYDERFVDLASVSRVYDLTNSLQTAISELFQLKSGLTYTASQTEAIFQGSHPLNFTILNSSFNEFNDFAKIHDNRTAIIGDMPKDYSLTISPNGINFKQNISENASYFLMGANKPTAYSFILNLMDLNITSCNTSSSPGNFNLHVSAVGNNGTYCNTTLTVDPLQTSYIGINAGSGGAMVVRLSNYSASMSAGRVKVAYTARVNYNDTIGEREYLTLNLPINISITGLSVKSFSNVRLT